MEPSRLEIRELPVEIFVTHGARVEMHGVLHDTQRPEQMIVARSTN
jgi:hypothetical protein